MLSGKEIHLIKAKDYHPLAQKNSLTSPLWRTLTVVGVDSIYTCSSIGTLVAGTVIDVVLTVSSIKT